MFRRISSMLLALCLILLVGCGTSKNPTDNPPSSSDQTADAQPIRIGGLTGPTSIGMVQLMEQSDAKKSALPYEFTLAATADELVPLLTQGKLDMAAIPANLAAVLHKNTDGAICVVAVNTLGVLSILEKGDSTINSISDLKGKTIYATGKGSTPEYTLRYLLEKNGLNPDKDLTIAFRSEPNEVVSLLAANPTGIAMLPQPYVTVAQGKVEGLRIAIDLTKAWDALNTDSTLITGVMVARRAFLDENAEQMTKFMMEYEASIDYAKQNVEQAAALCEKHGVVKAAIAKQAIPYCNLTFLAGTEMKTALSGYLEVLYAQNKASVGNALPSDDFYFGT